MKETILVAVALLPAIALCGYVFYKDRVEKEPLSLLLLLLTAGAICCYPASFLEHWLSPLIDGVFRNATPYVYQFMKYFFGVALVEEGMKLFALTYLTKKNENFDCFFDGLIYSVFISLGFAALENVMYSFSYGMETALLRAVTAVPGHMFFAVLMGYHYSFWHLKDHTLKTEQRLITSGMIIHPKRMISSRNNRLSCLLVPVLAHGLYDYLCVLSDVWALWGLVIFLLGMYVYCFATIRKMSLDDQWEQIYIYNLLKKKYPELPKDFMWEQNEPITL